MTRFASLFWVILAEKDGCKAARYLVVRMEPVNLHLCYSAVLVTLICMFRIIGILIVYRFVGSLKWAVKSYLESNIAVVCNFALRLP